MNNYMKSYYQALEAVAELPNMPNPDTKPGLFIVWSEDICALLADIYSRDYNQVTEDLQKELDLLDDD